MSEKSASKRSTRRGLMVLTGIIASVVTFAIGSQVALAHHSVLEASVNCSKVVSWKAEAWTPTPADDARRVNTDVKVWYQLPNSSTKYGAVHGAFNSGNDYEFSGSFTYPSGPTPSYIVVYAQEQVGWGVNHDLSAPSDAASIKVYKPGSCPGVPSTAIKVVCADGNGTVTVTLKTTGGQQATTFVVTPAGGSPTSYSLNPDSTKDVIFTNVPDGYFSVTITVGDKDYSQMADIDCDRPGTPVPGIALECANGNGTVTVTLGNSGGELPITYVVTPQGQATQTVVVPPQEFRQIVIHDVADGYYSVSVMVGDTEMSQMVDVDCDRPGTPVSGIAFTCANGNGTVTLTLSNSVGELPITFVVTPPGGPAQNVSVAPLSSQSVDFLNIADGPFTVSVMVGEADYSQTITVNCDRPGTPVVNAVPSCSEGDGVVTVTLQNTIGELPITFTVSAPGFPEATYPVGPLGQQIVTIGNVADGPFTVTIHVGEVDYSQTVAVKCDRDGGLTATALLECAKFDGSLTVLFTYTGGENPIDITFGPDSFQLSAQTLTREVTLNGLPDGAISVEYTVNGLPADLPFDLPDVSCDAILTGAPICNEVDIDNEVEFYWFTVNNPEDADVDVTWTDGQTVIPAGGSTTIKSSTPQLVLEHNGVPAVSLTAGDEICYENVTFLKEVLGTAPAGETYTIRVSRLVGDEYDEETTFDLVAGEPKSFTLPSTMDPDGIVYKVEEISFGTAVTHTVSPDSFALTGNLGETVNVVVTNGYAAVQIDKTVSAKKINAGDNLTYTLVATNTGGLTLDPVVISDLFPPQEAVVSASVADDGGSCVVVRMTRPQILECTMNAALPVNGKTPLITIVVKTDDDTPTNSNLLNQAKVLGTYLEPDDQQTDSAATRTEAEESLSCIPVIAGTVCDLSAEVGTLVEGGIENEPPTLPPTTQPPVTSTPPPTTLPVTGGSGLGNILAIAFVFVTAGFVLVRRRRPSAG